jgi:hypothetical protein
MEERRDQRTGNWNAVLAYGPIGTLILGGLTHARRRFRQVDAANKEITRRLTS